VNVPTPTENPSEEQIMRVELDEPKCVASGQCVMAAPEVFDQRDEDGIAFVLDENPSADALGDVREAVAICPAAAIRLVDQ
jgi:ferredoxin